MSVSFTFILFENQIQTTSASPYRTQVQLAASFLVCSLIFIEYYLENDDKYLPSIEYLRYTSINYLFLAFKISRRGYEI